MAIWQYAGFVINFLVQIALTALLPTSYFGYMATLQVSMELLTGITTLSFHGTLYRTYDEDIEKTTNHALFLGILQAAITLTLSGGIAYYFYTNSQFDWKAILFCLLYQVSIIANNFKMIIYTSLEKHKTFVRNSQIESSINLMIAKKNLVKVPILKGTVPHEMEGKFDHSANRGSGRDFGIQL